MKQEEVKEMCFKLAVGWVIEKDVKCIVRPSKALLMKDITELTKELMKTYKEME